MKRKPVIGIVGGVGSGKSLVAAELVQQGGYLISGDQLGHEALQQPQLKQRVLERFGPEFATESGEIDRRKLGRHVFRHVEELRALEAISFPFIEKRIRAEIGLAQQDPKTRSIVLDAAIMLETGWDGVCDHLIFVDAPENQRLARVRSQRDWSDEELRRREAMQMSVQEKRRHAEAIVHNDGSIEDLKLQVQDLLMHWGIVELEPATTRQ